MKYRPEIDGLRTIAVLAVIFNHAGFSFFSGGFVGVDVFFVISGFLITNIIVEKLENKDFSLIEFYEKRARRILPALYLVMLSCIPFAIKWLFGENFISFSKSLMATSLFFSNFFFWRQKGDYFGVSAEESPLLHTWSLSLEEQFYILFPLLLMGVWRWGKRASFYSILVFGVVSFLFCEWGWRFHPTANFYLLPTRFWEILSGTVCALVVRGRGEVAKLNFSFIGLVMICASVVLFRENIAFPSYYTLVPVLGTVLILIPYGYNGLVYRLLSNKTMVSLGLVSYSAYLWHQPVFAFTRIRTVGEPTFLVMLFLCILVFVLSYFSWKYVERPFRDKTLVSSKVFFLFAVLGFVSFVSLGVSSFNLSASEKPNRIFSEKEFSKEDLKWALKLRSASKSDVCDVFGMKLFPEEICYSNSSEPEVLIAGDSKAMALSSCIFAGYIDLSAVLIAAHSCPIYPGLSYKPSFEKTYDNYCTEISNKIANIKKSIPSIKKVYFMSRIITVNETASRYFVGEENLSKKESFIAGYSNLVSKLLESGLEIVFIEDGPSFKDDPSHCLLFSYSNVDDCVESRDALEESRYFYKKLLASIQKKYRFPVFRAMSVFCDEKECRSISKEGKLLFFDKTHMTPFGASKLLEAVFDREKIIKEN